MTVLMVVFVETNTITLNDMKAKTSHCINMCKILHRQSNNVFVIV
jgi:hypothetical protein